MGYFYASLSNTPSNGRRVRFNFCNNSEGRGTQQWFAVNSARHEQHLQSNAICILHSFIFSFRAGAWLYAIGSRRQAHSPSGSQFSRIHSRPSPLPRPRGGPASAQNQIPFRDLSGESFLRLVLRDLSRRQWFVFSSGRATSRFL